MNKNCENYDICRRFGIKKFPDEDLCENCKMNIETLCNE